MSDQQTDALRQEIDWHKATKQALMDAHEAAVRERDALAARLSECEAALREAVGLFTDGHAGSDEAVEDWLDRNAALAAAQTEGKP